MKTLLSLYREIRQKCQDGNDAKKIKIYNLVDGQSGYCNG